MSTPEVSPQDYGVAELHTGQSRELSEFLARLTLTDLPAAVLHEARRAVLDWVGCALAGSAHPTLDMLHQGLMLAGGTGEVPVIGRSERLPPMSAALANGQAGHVLDFDDTHMGGVVLHASSPLLSALFALAPQRQASGAQLLLAFVAGFEAAVRAGQAAPAHHDGGWHLTGTLGSIGAGVAAGKLLGLDPVALNHALGIATTQAAGMQQNRGTSCKSFHAGRAASNGVLAGLLAQAGFTASPEILEGRKGFVRTYSKSCRVDRVNADLGSRWELLRNGYKPYACGVVLHPMIDAVIDAARQLTQPPEAITALELRVHPMAVRITGVHKPRTGLMSKFSIYHSAAVACVDLAAGVAQYSDARASDPQLLALSEKVRIQIDDSLANDQAHATIHCADGSSRQAGVTHARGTADNPLSDEALQQKFRQNAGTRLSLRRVEQLVTAIWQLDRAPRAADLLALTQPG